MIQNLETKFTHADFPASPVAPDIALEADVSEADALAAIQGAWQLVETFTGRTFRDTTAGKVIVKVAQEHPFPWPRFPFPDALTIEVFSNSSGGWVDHHEIYIPALGWVELVPWTIYRLTQVGTVTGETPSPAVMQAVRNLALYQLVHAPARREFKSQTAGDTGFSREGVMGVMYGSGAGALLAGEVRL